MPSLKNQKTVKDLSEKFKAMSGLILTEYRGLTVKEISELRSKLRPFNSDYTVVKNTLGKIALKEVGIEVDKHFLGFTALVIENGDVVCPAKVVVDFVKTHAKLKIKGGFLEGRFVGVEVVEQLSALPSREVLVSKMLGSMNAPISRLVNVLSASIRKILNVLDAISKK